MKTRLLKKIRKRFSWYLNSQKRPVLIDKYSEKVKTYSDIDISILTDSKTFSEFIKESEQIKNKKAWNYFMSDMLSDYGYSKKVKNWRFRTAISNLKKLELKNKKFRDYEIEN